VELRADHFDAARSLAKEAFALNAPYTLFDVRPEHILAEVDRKERSAGVFPVHPSTDHASRDLAKPTTVVTAAAPPADPFAGAQLTPANPPAEPTAAPSQALPQITAAVNHQPHVLPPAESPAPADRLKAKAIEILDHGLQALEENRFDDAERYARAALSLHASFDKLEYKPEYLITEVGIARARQRLDAATTPSSSPQSAASSQSTQPLVAPHADYPQEVSLAASQAVTRTSAVAAAPIAPPKAPQADSHAPQTASASAAISSRQRAEGLLHEALADLHAGHDDVARARIEGALGVIHPTSAPRLPMLAPAATPAIVSPQGLPHVDLRQTSMPSAGFPAYVPDAARDAHDVALKPLHDPYLGDEPNTTNKSTAGENSFRESLPNFAPMTPTVSLNRPLPTMTDDQTAHSTGSFADLAAVGSGRPRTVADTDNQPAKVRWPENQPAPGSQSAAVPASSAAPAGQPAAKVAYSSPSAYVPAPAAESSTGSTSQPGYFRKLWNALKGD
jgi:hypothetical protein